jgi:hypothetical protein
MDCFVANAPRNDEHMRFTFQTTNTVIASEAKQSTPQGRMDCFVANAPRNDERMRFTFQTTNTVIASEAKQSMPQGKNGLLRR